VKPSLTIMLCVAVLSGCATFSAVSRADDAPLPSRTVRSSYAMDRTAPPPAAAALPDEPVDAWPPAPDPFMEAMASEETQAFDEEIDTHTGHLDRVLRGLEALARQGRSVQQSLLRLRVKPPSPDGEQGGGDSDT
jgi:hypothetical protein